MKRNEKPALDTDSTDENVLFFMVMFCVRLHLKTFEILSVETTH